jgi:hypothetical protein
LDEIFFSIQDNEGFGDGPTIILKHHLKNGIKSLYSILWAFDQNRFAAFEKGQKVKAERKFAISASFPKMGLVRIYTSNSCGNLGEKFQTSWGMRQSGIKLLC